MNVLLVPKVQDPALPLLSRRDGIVFELVWNCLGDVPRMGSLWVPTVLFLPLEKKVQVKMTLAWCRESWTMSMLGKSTFSARSCAGWYSQPHTCM